VIAVSQFTRGFAEETLRVKPDSIRLIYHGRSDELARGETTQDRVLLGTLGDGREYILSPGSLLPYRRCEDVIAAFDVYCGKTQDAPDLVIAGSGTDSRYRAVIERAVSQSPNRDRIRLVGHVSRDVMSALYRCCKICVIASEIEACPNIAIEAMGSGCAIVSSDRQPLPEILDGASVQFESRDVTSCYESIRRLMGDVRLRHVMKEKALSRAEFFSWDKCARETFAALTEW